MIILARLHGLNAENFKRFDIRFCELGTAGEVYESSDGCDSFDDDGKRVIYYAADYNSVYIPLNQFYVSCSPAVGDCIICDELPAFTIETRSLIAVIDNPDKNHPLPIIMICNVDSDFKL